MKNPIQEQQLETLSVQSIEANLTNSLVVQTSSFGIFFLIILFIGVIFISNLTQNKDRPKTKRTSKKNRRNSTSNNYAGYFDAGSSSSGDCGSYSSGDVGGYSSDGGSCGSDGGSYGSDAGGCDAGF